MKKVIDVSLYGGKSIFGGKEVPLEAVVTSCDKSDSCSFYQQGQCLALRGFLTSGCRHGNSSTHKGYTSRAKKYYEFERKWKEHPEYNKLQRPPKKLGIIDGHVYFPYPYVTIREDLSVGDPEFVSRPAYIPLSLFTTDLINRIVSLRPQAFMGGTIKSYQEETVPLFLTHLKEVLPDIYEAFKEEYPDKVTEINYVGRRALLKTIKPSLVKYESKRYPNLNEQWEWDGTYLNYISGRVSSVSVTKDYEIVQFIVKPSDTSEVVITSNEQVQESTIFVD